MARPTLRITPFILIVSALWAPLEAQQLTAAEIQRLLQNPQTAQSLRIQLETSGLTAEQIRAQLLAAGVAPSDLDAFLRNTESSALAASDSILGVDKLQLFVDSLRAAAEAASPDDAVVIDPLAYDQFVERYGQPLADSLDLARGLPAPGLFGLDIFSQPSTQFLPDLTGPVDEDYRLGPGDVLVLVLTGDVEIGHTLEITREGYVIIPQVGQVYASRLTLQEFRAVLRERLGRAYSGVRSGSVQFEITVARVRLVQVSVIGEVARPGTYQTPSVSTALTALYQAGGPTERGNFRAITIRRGGDTVATLDLYDYLLHGAALGDVPVQSGDVVFVPVHGKRVTIAGAALRPGTYELTEQETLADVVSAAGGFRADAALRRMSVSRIVPPAQRVSGAPDRIVVDVPLEQVVDGRAPPFPLEAGDSVTVFAVDSTNRATVEVKGAVYLPGTFGWAAGLRLSRVVQLAGGFKPAVYAGRAHIERLNPTDSTRFLIDVVLPASASAPYPNDVELQDYDVITIYGRDEFRQERNVTILGMVNQPGTYPYRAGMTLKDFVLMARGLQDGASIDTAEIARLPRDRSDGTLADITRVPLDSTYFFEPTGTTYPMLPGTPGRDNGAPDFLIQPFDQVTILKQPEFELQQTVQVTGHVRFPGTYALVHRDERLSNLVQRAGGLLPTAYTEGSRFIRPMDSTGRINIELPVALSNPGGVQDLVLQPGDSLHVPEYLPTVRVLGAVTAPTSVLFLANADLQHYIDNAGGYTRNADKGRVAVRYANGSAGVKTVPGPGSTVFVPENPPGSGVDPVVLFTSIASVLASLLTIIVVLTK